MDAEATKNDPNVKPPTRAKWFRWILVTGILIAGTGFAWSGRLRVCQTAPVVVTGPNSSGQEVRTGETCRGATVSDAIVVFVGIAALLLIMPDMQEAGAFGFTLKRRVEEQGKKQEEIATRLDALSIRADAQAQAISTSKVENTFYITSSEIQRLPESLHRKESFLLSMLTTESLPQKPILEPRTVDPDWAQQAQDLLGTWQQIERVMATLPSESRARLKSLFHEEISTIQGVRNAIAHAERIDDSDLEASLAAAKELLRILTSYPSGA